MHPVYLSTTILQVLCSKQNGWLCLGLTVALLFIVSVIIHIIKTAAVSVSITETPRHVGSILMGRSCAEAHAMDPTLLSGDYYVDPDGVNVGDDPISVYCNMSTGK